MQDLSDEIFLKNDQIPTCELHRFVGHDDSTAIVILDIHTENTVVPPKVDTLHQGTPEKDHLKVG